MKKRLLAIILAVVMLAGVMPFAALADEASVIKTGAELLAMANAGTITLTEDVVLTSTMVIPEGESLALDLGGYTLTVASTRNIADQPLFVPDAADEGMRKAAILVEGELTSVSNGTIISHASNTAAIFNKGTIGTLAENLTMLVKSINGDTSGWGGTAVENRGTIDVVSANISCSTGTSSFDAWAFVNAKGGTINSITNAVILGGDNNVGALYNGGVIETIDSSHIYCAHDSILSYNYAVRNNGGTIKLIKDSVLECCAAVNSKPRGDSVVLDNTGTINKIDNCTVRGQYDTTGTKGDANAIQSTSRILSMTGTKFYGHVGGSSKYISGGYYDVAPDFGVRVENYVSKQLDNPVVDEDGFTYNYQVVYDEAAYSAEKSSYAFVAQITKQDGTVNEYISAVDAFSAVKTNDTLTLLDDITVNAALTINNKQNVTIDLNGKVLTNTCTGTYAILLAYSKNLVIKDSSAEQTGCIAVTGGANYGIYLVGQSGYPMELVLESGTIKNTRVWTIGTQGLATVNVKGGYVLSSSLGNGHWPVRVVSTSSGLPTLIVSGGYFGNVASATSYFTDSVIFSGFEHENVTITGGYYKISGNANDNAVKNITNNLDSKYELTENTDPATKTEYPYTVTPVSVVKPEVKENYEIEVKTEGEEVKELTPEEKTATEQKVEKTLENKAVLLTEEQTGLNNVDIENTESKEIIIQLTGVAVKTEQKEENVEATITKMKFDVTPTVKVNGGDARKIENNEIPATGLKFRLPVDDSVALGTVAKVFHQGEQLDKEYVVKGDENGKYIEVIGYEFSEYSYELELDKVRKQGKIYGQTLLLQDSVYIRYYFDVDADEVKNYTVSYTFKGVEYKDIVLNKTRKMDNKNYYVIEIPVNVKEFTDEVDLTLTDITGAFEADSLKYSVRQYCVNQLKNNNDEKLKKVCCAMLDYGTYMQLYKNYNTDKLANAGEIEGYTATVLTAIPDGSYENSQSGSTDGISVYGKSLSLEDTIKVRFYFELADGESIEDYTFTSGDKTLTPVKNGSYYYVAVSGLAAKNLDSCETVTVTKGGSGDLTVNYSPMAYAYNQQNSTKAHLADVVKAQYQYCLAAKAVFGN